MYFEKNMNGPKSLHIKPTAIHAQNCARVDFRLKVIIPALMAALFWASCAFADPTYWRLSWPDTDFSKSSVNFNEIEFAGPGKDGIAAIFDPEFTPNTSQTELADREPVIVVALDEEIARAYPVRYLLIHEIVNDMIGQTPIAVTYCPLCNSAAVFDRRVTIDDQAQTLSFGVSGMLRHNDMVMYDHQTQSWWQQALGTAIIGKLDEYELTALPIWDAKLGAISR